MTTMKNELKERASGVKTLEDFSTFIESLPQEGYDNAIQACAAAMEAALSLMETRLGVLSNFQASVLGWEMINLLFPGGKDVGRYLIDYDELLYPQYETKFTSINREVHGRLVKAARRRLAEVAGDSRYVSPRVIAHWKRIVSGKIPFGLRLEE